MLHARPCWSASSAVSTLLPSAMQVRRASAGLHGSDPDYWGMTPEQAEKFAAARRGHVGMEQPWFTPLMLPNPDAGKPMSQAELMRYQAEWVLNTERDAQIIADEAEYLLGVAKGEIDFSGNPDVQA